MAAFTTIATGIGLAATAATTTMSFAQAGKQKRAAQDAERDAQAAMDAARKKLEINVFAAQGINKEPYALEREALLSAGAQAIEAGVESERGAAAVAGRIQMAQNEAQAQQTAAMSEEMTDLENKQLEEQSRLNDIGAQIDLGEAEGAQQAAANYDEMANNAQTQGWQGVTNLAGQIAATAPLYAKNQAFNGLQNTASQYGLSDTALQGQLSNLGVVNGYDTSALKSLNPQQFTETLKGLDPKVLNAITKQNFNGYNDLNSLGVNPIQTDIQLNPFMTPMGNIKNTNPMIPVIKKKRK